MSHPEWTPDKQPEHSPPDTWAAHNVKVHVEDTRPLTDLSVVSLDITEAEVEVCEKKEVIEKKKSAMK